MLLVDINTRLHIITITGKAKSHASLDGHITITVETVVACRPCIDVTSRDGHIAAAIDGIILCFHINLATTNSDSRLRLQAFMIG